MTTTRARPHDPRRLDVERFARDGTSLEGSWPLDGMPRLVEACHQGEAPQPGDVAVWSARGELRRVVGGETQTWLHMDVHARLTLTCQRCLAAVETALKVDRWFRFVASEEEAAELDAEIEDDVLVRSHALDLHQLAEDELLLALPIVPRHDLCPMPLRAAGADEPDQALPSPFAALAALKKKVRH